MEGVELPHDFRFLRGFLPFLTKDEQSRQLEMGTGGPGIDYDRSLPKRDRIGMQSHLPGQGSRDRKSTRLNSSHSSSSYAVFCLKKKTGNKLTRQKLGSVF